MLKFNLCILSLFMFLTIVNAYDYRYCSFRNTSLHAYEKSRYGGIIKCDGIEINSPFFINMHIEDYYEVENLEVVSENFYNSDAYIELYDQGQYIEWNDITYSSFITNVPNPNSKRMYLVFRCNNKESCWNKKTNISVHYSIIDTFSGRIKTLLYNLFMAIIIMIICIIGILLMILMMFLTTIIGSIPIAYIITLLCKEESSTT